MSDPRLADVIRTGRRLDVQIDRGYSFKMAFVFLGIVVFWLLVFLFINTAAHAEIYDAEQIVDAIYKAEGGPRAKKPYGILSVSCGTKDECREICYNTVVNNFTRWQVYGHEIHPDFIDFLGSRYAPIGANNDPSGLNRNWVRNVRFFLKREVKNV